MYYNKNCSLINEYVFKAQHVRLPYESKTINI